MTPSHERPRVEGEREHEIFEATLAVLAEVGYDRLTMDAVASRARASKATLYRRWSSKARLVVDALLVSKGPTALPETGSLRGDLLEVFCGLDGFVCPDNVALFGSVLTAITRDRDFADTYRRDVVAPKVALSRQLWERARERGEIDPDADLDLLESALPGMVLHRVFVLGDCPDQSLVERVLDRVVLPAATRGSHPRPEEPPS